MASHQDEELTEFLLSSDSVDPVLSAQAFNIGSSECAPQASPSCRRLYLSHFLSAWNSRLFEFGAFLFLIDIFPGTLLPVSVYALSRAAAATLLSPWVGKFIDRGDRLHVVRLSIVSQRLAVAASCALFFLMLQFSFFREDKVSSSSLLCLLSALACIEKLGSIMNTIAVERDWIVVIASSTGNELQVLNSRMRRIDLFCKLIGPLVAGLIDGISTKVAVVAVGSMSVISVLAEYFAIARVYRDIAALRMPEEAQSAASATRRALVQRLFETMSGAAQYCRHPAFLPSFSLALLYLTVLSFAGQMVAYLATLGVSSPAIGVLRGVSALFELSATWLAPAVVARIGSVRAGIWFINWQLLCVSAASLSFWLRINPSMAVVGTVVPVVASRVGLWGFDLSVQNIIQEEVEADLRGTFSSQEFALQNMFEMLAFATTIAFSRPEQFKIPATISASSVAVSGILFAMFVRARRGHLLHLSRCIDPAGHKHADHHHWWMRTRQSGI